MQLRVGLAAAVLAASSTFCPNVEWLRNRAITFGCTSATLYCPGTSVNRIQMAAFMNRLGTAMSAIPVLVEASGLGFDPATPQVVCTTNAFAVAEFPRRAHVDALVSLSGSATSGLEVDLVFSLNGGGSWSALNAQPHRALLSAGRWSHSRVLSHRDLAVGDSVRFGVRVGRGALPGSGLIVDGSCRLRIRFDNRNAGASPFDE